jgi:hypothetical protein
MLDHSGAPPQAPVQRNAVCSHPLHQGGYAAFRILGGSVFGHLVCAWALTR